MYAIRKSSSSAMIAIEVIAGKIRASRLPALPQKLGVVAPNAFWLLATAFALLLLSTVVKSLQSQRRRVCRSGASRETHSASAGAIFAIQKNLPTTSLVCCRSQRWEDVGFAACAAPTKSWAGLVRDTRIIWDELRGRFPASRCAGSGLRGAALFQERRVSVSSP
jgi:hypothetical protein